MDTMTKPSLRNNLSCLSRINFIVLLFVALSYNLPKFSPSASWNPNGITFADSTTVGTYPFMIFIDNNNTVYVTDLYDHVQVWFEGSSTPTKTLLDRSARPAGLFVASSGNIYVGNLVGNQVKKWSLETLTSDVMTNFDFSCSGLFIDNRNDLYCSIASYFLVVKRPLNDSTRTPISVAGDRSSAITKNNLKYTYGIFVDDSLNLYAADCKSDGVWLFLRGQSNGTLVAGIRATVSFALNCPANLVLDADGYLFIADTGNNRVVASGPRGFRCVVGCSNSLGSQSHQLHLPFALSFDSYGNIFVTDELNSRVQKFYLAINDSVTSTTTTATISTTTTAKPQNSWQCVAPIITLMPSTPRSAPRMFLRSQDLFILSYIELDCNISLSISTKWEINYCESTCASQAQISQSIITNFSDLFIPARSLTYGMYMLKLTVTMTASPNMTSSSVTYITIIPSNITASLVQLGTSVITRGHHQELILDPGTFSVDPDETTFDSSKWCYKYYCRIVSQYSTLNSIEALLPIDDSIYGTLNLSCFNNSSGKPWQYTSDVSLQSTLKIFAGSLTSNQTYQFIVHMVHYLNITRQATGYLLVQIVDTSPPLIAVACTVSTICITSNSEFQMFNPTTQLSLFSVCIENCSSIHRVTWIIYQGFINIYSGIVEWTLFNELTSNQTFWLFGMNTPNLTIANELFLRNRSILYWRFQVIYSFTSMTSSSALNFKINQSPQNGSCSLSPLNGTTSTLFTISCLNWVDDNGIKDYSFYVWKTDPYDREMLGFTTDSMFRLYLPAGDEDLSSLNIIVRIRDMHGGVTEYRLQSIVVVPDFPEAQMLINVIEDSSIIAKSNIFMRLLASRTQNTIAQAVTILSQLLNRMNRENIQKAMFSNINATSILVSPLFTTSLQSSNRSLNTSRFFEYSRQMNDHAMLRDYFMTYIVSLQITTLESILLQASSLSRLTGATNQLTRAASTLASTKCQQLSFALRELTTKVSYEDIQSASVHCIQCISNVLTAINGPLQSRTMVLNMDLTCVNAFPIDYDNDLEYNSANWDFFMNREDLSSNTIQSSQNIYCQRQMANTIAIEATKTLSLITAALSHHLNTDQIIRMNTSAVFFSLETVFASSLSRTLVQLIGIAQIHIPSILNMNLTNDTRVIVQSMVQPLASASASQSQSNTNLSRSISLSVLDQNGNNIPIRANVDDPFEFIIPRDPNIRVPSMSLQNVTSITDNHNQLFYLQYVNITQSNQNITISLHFEMRPLNTSLGYIFIYQFDNSPQLSSSINHTDGWSLWCPSNLTNDGLYTYFIDNHRTAQHQSIIFGLRELNATEIEQYCKDHSISYNPPVSEQFFHFSSDYELRVYASGCYYLDSNNNWQSDGLLVGPLTNHFQTQCFSTHLTTFAGGFFVLPAPVHLDCVFVETGFTKSKTLYLAVACAFTIYFVLVSYARIKDRHNVEKLSITHSPDSFVFDRYLYQIILIIGQKKGAITQSKIYFIVSGDNEETTIRIFDDSHRKILQRGKINVLNKAVPKSLYSLSHIHIWYGNTTRAASTPCFLKCIILRDLQTMERLYFFRQQLLGLEKKYARIERPLMIDDDLQKQELCQILTKNA